MWACGQHEAHLDELAEQALEIVAGRAGELSGGELAKLSCGLVAAEVRDVRHPATSVLCLCFLADVHTAARIPAHQCTSALHNLQDCAVPARA